VTFGQPPEDEEVSVGRSQLGELWPFHVPEQEVADGLQGVLFLL